MFDESKSRALRPAVWPRLRARSEGRRARVRSRRPPPSAAARGAPCFVGRPRSRRLHSMKTRVGNRRARGLACLAASRRRSLLGPESRTTIPVLGDSTSGSREGTSDQSPPPARAAGWLLSFLSPAPSSGGSRPRPRMFLDGPTGQGFVAVPRAAPRGSDSIKWKNAWPSLVTALASRSDKREVCTSRASRTVARRQ
jgi:hypothetical protein